MISTMEGLKINEYVIFSAIKLTIISAVDYTGHQFVDEYT